MTNEEPKPRLRFRSACLWVTMLLGVLLVALYWSQPDWLVPITMVPAWAWLVVLVFLLGIGFKAITRTRLLMLSLPWLCFVVLFVEELRSYTRFKTQPIVPVASKNFTNQHDRAVRVVSLNCNVGNLKCAQEVADYHPDVVLLQESPGPRLLEQLAEQLFGSEGTFIWCGDAAIVTGQAVVSKHEDTAAHFGLVELEFRGRNIAIVSLRLSPPVFRLDFWSTGFWQDHYRCRNKHREQLEQVMQELNRFPQAFPVLVGGDFNSVAGDGALDVMSDRMSDSFKDAGIGWGGSGTNDFPLFRVDQIWNSKQLIPIAVTTRKTEHSDHRMVVADFLVK